MSEGRQIRRRVIALTIVFAGTVLLCERCALGQDPALDLSQYAHTAWKVRDGFTRGLIHGIAQSPDGYLWLATEFGLVRFDGVRTVPWQPSGGQQLPSNDIQNLLFARDGTLWIGTLNGLASWKDGKLTTYPEMAGQLVFPLLQDREGTIWAGGVRPPPTAPKLCSIRNARMECDGGVNFASGIFRLYEDSLQNLWVGVPNGFWRWKPGPPKFFAAPSDAAGIEGFCEDDRHALLIGMKSGIHRFVNGHIEAHPLAYRGLNRGLTSSVQRIFRDRDGNLWITTLTHGLIHVHRGRADTFSSSDGLSGDSVSGILEDREGNVWVSTSEGLDRFRPYIVPTISRSQGLSNALIFSALAAKDGRVWIATPSGLDSWDQGRISAFVPSDGAWKPVGTFDEASPHSLFEDSSGRFWISTGRSFGYLDEGRFVSVSGYPGGYVRGIAEGPAGRLWLANQPFGLLQVFQGKVVQQLSWPGLGYGTYGNDLAVDPEKKGLWIGFWKGGVAYLEENKVRASYSAVEGLGQGSVNQLRFDSYGTLWAATEGGLSRIRNGHVATLSSRNGLPCDVVHWSIEDDDHAVWLYTPCGLVRVAKDQLDAWAADARRVIHARVLDASDGVRTHSWVGLFKPLVTKANNGNIWFITSGGISILDPHHLCFNSLPPPVHIEQMIADGKAYDASSGLRLPPLARNLDIDYTALSLVIPERVRFRVKLEGQDKDWRELVNDRHAHYTNLAPKHYRFLVKASNNNGVWNEEGAFVDFAVLPAYYQTSWFRALCVAAFMALLWWIYRIRVGVLEQHRGEITALNDRLMEVLEEERARIAGELHDGVLQKLTFLSLSLGAAKRQVPPDSEAKEKIADVQKKLIEVGTEVRQLSHELHPPVLQESGLPEALSAYCDEFAKAHGIPVSCEADKTVRDLSPGAALCIYRIAQEALGNAGKHSKANKVKVRLTRTDSRVCLSVSDDGVGFASNRPAESGGLGLINMRERVRQLHGTLELESEPGCGTTIRAEVPFRPAP